jgi:hypothetical protein
LIATWHLMTVDQARLSKELCDLDAKQHVLDLKIREAADQQRHSSDVRQRDQAAQDEATYVAEMDRLMTRMRAVEALLLLKRRAAEPPPPASALFTRSSRQQNPGKVRH